MKSLLTFVLALTLVGCFKAPEPTTNEVSQYQWDEEAQRCRDMSNGQFIEDSYCGK